MYASSEDSGEAEPSADYAFSSELAHCFFSKVNSEFMHTNQVGSKWDDRHDYQLGLN